MVKKKALEASQKEYNKGLQRNINFTRYVSKNWPKLEPKGLHIQDLLKEITKIEFKNSDLNSSGYSEENMKQLLDLSFLLLVCRQFINDLFRV